MKIKGSTWKINRRPRKRKIEIRREDKVSLKLRSGFQMRVYRNLGGRQNTVLKSPTGSGKTKMITALFVKDVRDSGWKRKQLVTIPQLKIAKGFVETEFVTVDNDEFRVSVRNYCGKESKSVSDVKKFLLETSTYTNEKRNKAMTRPIAVCSHQALVAAFKQMPEEEKMFAVASTALWVDEFHHVLGADDSSANGLGTVVNEFLRLGGHIHLASATPFRGDRQRIINPEYMRRFVIENVTLMEHLEMTDIENVSVDYLPYKDKDDILEKIMAKIEAEPDEPAIIILPSDTQKFFTKSGDKNEFARKLRKRLVKLYGDTKVIDFVTPENQKKDSVRFDKSTTNGSEFSVIITCAMGREGMDWPKCSRVHNLVFDRSVQLQIQKFGRALRHYPGKKTAGMYNYIVDFSGWNKEDTRERVSDCFNAVVGMAVVDDMINTLLIPVVGKAKGKGETRRQVSLEEIFPGQVEEIYEQLAQEFQTLGNEEITPEAIDSIIMAVIDGRKRHEDVEEEDLIDMLRARLTKMANKNNAPELNHGIDARFIRQMGWDVVVRKYIVGHNVLGAGLTVKDLDEMRKFLIRSTDEEQYALYMKLEKRRGSIPKVYKFIEGREEYRSLKNWMDKQWTEGRREARDAGLR